MKNLKPVLLFSFVAIFLAWLPAAKAAMTPLAFSIVPGVQFPSKEYTITGARFSLLWGRHRDLDGLDLGIIGNITDVSFTGIGISGLFNLNEGATTITGLQFAGITNINTKQSRIYGFQIAPIANINVETTMMAGIQLSLFNMSGFTELRGLQLGIYNSALDVYGLQIGVVNVAKSLHGVQIGLLNFNQTGLFYVAPILNVGF